MLCTYQIIEVDCKTTRHQVLSFFYHKYNITVIKVFLCANNSNDYMSANMLPQFFHSVVSERHSEEIQLQ